jgi:hypothetical protein
MSLTINDFFSLATYPANPQLKSNVSYSDGEVHFSRVSEEELTKKNSLE